MNESKISVRYAKALFQLAVEKDLLDEVYEDMHFISEVCKHEQLVEVLDSPIIIPSKKKAILHGILDNNVESITLSLVDLLITNGREEFLPAVSRVFRSETLRYRGITDTTLITAVPVNDKIRQQITDLVTSAFKTSVELKEIVDDEIVGGFILKVDDNYIDASVRNKLRKIRKGLSVKTLKSE